MTANPWERVCKVMADADLLEELARIHMEANISRPGAVTWEQALEWAKDMRERYAPESGL